MGPIQSFSDFADMVRRRAPLILLVVVAGSIASVLYALAQPVLYRASEVLQVVRPQISDEMASSTVEGSAARRLQLVEQRLMARDSVLEIIDRFGLYTDMPALLDSERVALFRSSVRMEGVEAAREGTRPDGALAVLRISADMPSPLQARDVAHALAQRTIALSREARLGEARATLEFLRVREQSLAEQVARLEAEIADFRERHDVALPGSIEFTRNELAALNEALLALARERIGLQREAQQVDARERPATAARMKADIAEQIATIDAQRDLLLERKAELRKSIETTPEIERQLGAYDRKLRQLQEQLNDATDRRSAAEIGYRLEEARQSQRLVVIEPAQLPDYPVSGGRRKIAVLGGAASVALALFLAFLLEFRRPVIRSAAQMERELGFRPVVTIPVMETGTRRRRG